MKDWLTLTAALRRTMADHAPDWTEDNDHDPGSTILDIMAYLADGLQRHGSVDHRRASAASRIVRALGASRRQKRASATRHECWSGTVRPRYFSGRLLTADDLNDEQEYHLEKHRRHLQLLHGWGIVDGLQVTVEGDGDEATITIGPGFALDCYGREISLDDTVTLTVPSDAPSPAWLIIEYAERMVDPLPTADGSEPSRIEEGCDVRLSRIECESGISVARLTREDEGWRLDTSSVARGVTRR